MRQADFPNQNNRICECQADFSHIYTYIKIDTIK